MPIELSDAEQVITDQLANAGWTLDYTVTTNGGYDTPSKFDVTIIRAGIGKFYTTYGKGAGHRRWRKNARIYDNSVGGIHLSPKYFGKAVRGEQVTIPYQHQLNVAAVSNREVLAFYAEQTEPIPPHLCEVMYSLVSDANTVRHGQTFAEFCGEFGYSTDSIKARETFNACTDTWRNLVAVRADLDKLTELFSDY